MEQSITLWDYIYLSQGEKPTSKTEKWNSSPAFCSPWRCFERIAVAEKVHKALPHLLSNQGHLLRSPSGIKICKVLIVVFSHLRILVLFPLDMRFHSSIIFLAYYISEKLKKKKKKKVKLIFSCTSRMYFLDMWSYVGLYLFTITDDDCPSMLRCFWLFLEILYTFYDLIVFYSFSQPWSNELVNSATEMVV